MRASLLAVAALAASIPAGCTFPTQQAYRDSVQTWVGRPADSLVMAWGAPNRSFDFSDGGRLLEYDRQQTRYVSGPPIYDRVPVRVRDSSGNRRLQYVSVLRDTPGYYDIDRCVTRFRVGRDNRIQEASFNGDWCVAYPPREPPATTPESRDPGSPGTPPTTTPPRT